MDVRGPDNLDCGSVGILMILKLIAFTFAGVIVVAGLAIVACVMSGAISVGNLWLLLPLAFYAVAFCLLGSLADML